MLRLYSPLSRCEDSVCNTSFFLPKMSEKSLSETSCLLLCHHWNNEGSHIESSPIIYNSFHVSARSQNCEKREVASSYLSFRLSFSPSVHPHGITRLPLKEFSLNLKCFSKICREKSSFIKI